MNGRPFGRDCGVAMEKMEKSIKSKHSVYPGVDRSIIKVEKAPGDSDDKAFWLSKTPLDHLDAVELLR